MHQKQKTKETQIKPISNSISNNKLRGTIQKYDQIIKNQEQQNKQLLIQSGNESAIFINVQMQTNNYISNLCIEIEESNKQCLQVNQIVHGFLNNQIDSVVKNSLHGYNQLKNNKQIFVKNQNQTKIRRGKKNGIRSKSLKTFNNINSLLYLPHTNQANFYHHHLQVSNSKEDNKSTKNYHHLRKQSKLNESNSKKIFQHHNNKLNGKRSLSYANTKNPLMFGNIKNVNDKQVNGLINQTSKQNAKIQNKGNLLSKRSKSVNQKRISQTKYPSNSYKFKKDEKNNIYFNFNTKNQSNQIKSFQTNKYSHSHIKQQISNINNSIECKNKRNIKSYLDYQISAQPKIQNQNKSYDAIKRNTKQYSFIQKQRKMQKINNQKSKSNYQNAINKFRTNNRQIFNNQKYTNNNINNNNKAQKSKLQKKNPYDLSKTKVEEWKNGNQNIRAKNKQRQKQKQKQEVYNKWMQMQVNSQLVNKLRVDPVQMYQLKNNISQQQFKQAFAYGLLAGPASSFNFSQNYIVSRGNIFVRESASDQIKQNSSIKSYISGVEISASCSGSHENSAYHLVDYSNQTNKRVQQQQKNIQKQSKIQFQRKMKQIASIAHLENEQIQNLQKSNGYNLVTVNASSYAYSSLQLPQNSSKNKKNSCGTQIYCGSNAPISNSNSNIEKQKSALILNTKWNAFKNEIQKLNFSVPIWNKITKQTLKARRNVYTALCTNFSIENSKYIQQFSQQKSYIYTFNDAQKKQMKKKQESRKQKIHIKFQIILDFSVTQEENSNEKNRKKYYYPLKIINKSNSQNKRQIYKKEHSHDKNQINTQNDQKQIYITKQRNATRSKSCFKKSHENIAQQINIQGSNTFMHFQINSQEQYGQVSQKIIAACSSLDIGAFLNFISEYLKFVVVSNSKNGKKLQVIKVQGQKNYESKRSKSKQRRNKQLRRAQKGKQKRVKICHQNIIKQTKHVDDIQIKNHTISKNTTKQIKNLNNLYTNKSIIIKQSGKQSRVISFTEVQKSVYEPKQRKYYNICYGYYYKENQNGSEDLFIEQVQIENAMKQKKVNKLKGILKKASIEGLAQCQLQNNKNLEMITFKEVTENVKKQINEQKQIRTLNQLKGQPSSKMIQNKKNQQITQKIVNLQDKINNSHYEIENQIRFSDTRQFYINQTNKQIFSKLISLTEFNNKTLTIPTPKHQLNIKQYGFNKKSKFQIQKRMRQPKQFKYRGFVQIYNKYFLFDLNCTFIQETNKSIDRLSQIEFKKNNMVNANGPKAKINIQIFHELLNQSANINIFQITKNKNHIQKNQSLKLTYAGEQIINRSSQTQKNEAKLYVQHNFNQKRKQIMEDCLNEIKMRKYICLQQQWDYHTMFDFQVKEYKNIMKRKELYFQQQDILQRQLNRQNNLMKIRKNLVFNLAHKLGKILISQKIFGIHNCKNQQNVQYKQRNIKQCSHESNLSSKSYLKTKNSKIKIIQCEQTKHKFENIYSQVTVFDALPFIKQKTKKKIKGMIKFSSLNQYVDVETGDKCKAKSKKIINAQKNLIQNNGQKGSKNSFTSMEKQNDFINIDNMKQQKSKRSSLDDSQQINIRLYSSQGARMQQIQQIMQGQKNKANISQFLLLSSGQLQSQTVDKMSKKISQQQNLLKKQDSQFEKVQYIPILYSTLPQIQVNYLQKQKNQGAKNKFYYTNTEFNRLNFNQRVSRVSAINKINKIGQIAKNNFKKNFFSEQNHYTLSQIHNCIYGYLNGKQFYYKILSNCQKLRSITQMSQQKINIKQQFSHKIQQKYLQKQIKNVNQNCHQFYIYNNNCQYNEWEFEFKRGIDVEKIILQTAQRISGFYLNGNRRNSNAHVFNNKKQAIKVKCILNCKQISQNNEFRQKQFNLNQQTAIKFIITPMKSSKIYYIQTTIQRIRAKILKQDRKHYKKLQLKTDQKLDIKQAQTYAKKLRKYPSYTYYKYSEQPPIYKILYRKTKKICIGMFIIFSVIQIEQMKCGFVNAYINWLQKTFYFKISIKRFKKAKQAFDSYKFWEQTIEMYAHRLKNIYFKKQVDVILEQLKIKNLKLYHQMMCKNGIDTYNSNNFRALCETRGAKNKRCNQNSNKKTQNYNLFEDQEIIMYELITQKFVFDNFGRKFLIIFYAICSQPKNIDIQISNSQSNCRNKYSIQQNNLQCTKNAIQIQILQSNKFSKLHFVWNFHHSLRNQSKYLRQNQIKKNNENLQNLQNQIMLQLLKISLISPMRMYKKLLEDVYDCIRGEKQNCNQNLTKMLKLLFQVNKKRPCYTNILQALLSQGEIKSYYNYYKYFGKGQWILIEKQTSKQLNRNNQLNLNQLKQQKHKRIFIQYEKSQTKKQITPINVGFQDCVPIQLYNKRLSKRMAKIISNTKKY